MVSTSRLAALGAAVSLAAVLAGCGAAEQPATNPPAAAPTTTPGAPPATSAAPAPGNGTTEISDIYGPACSQVPTQGEGSAQGMADDPVGTAASNNPLLTRLVEAVQAAGLVDTLNQPTASYTVFAPSNAAFEALPAEQRNQLMADPRGQLSEILTYHVLPQRYDAAGLAQAGTVTTVQGSQLRISGEPTSLVIDDQQRASVLCGNIPTANATVFVIDKILLPEA
ncbi:MAG: fasciclin domain-containing protein [Pseudonocardia sp.]